MGYDLYVTRRENWDDEDGPFISLSDWLGYLAIDSSLQRDVQFDSGRSRSNGHAEESTHVIWTEWPGQGEGKEARFHLDNGNIVANNTDAATRQKLFIMADVMGAKLQGTKGESFNSLGEPERGGRRKSKKASGPEKTWWQFW